MIIRLKRNKVLPDLNLKLFSVGTDIDGLVFDIAENDIKFLLEKKEYSAQNTSVIINDNRTLKNELRMQILGEIGQPLLGFEESFEEAQNSVAYSFLAEDRRNNVILIQYHLIPNYSVSYLDPLFLHELLHNRKTYYTIVESTLLPELCQELQVLNPELVKPLTYGICLPLIRSPVTCKEIGIYKKEIRLVGIQRVLPALEGGSSSLLKSFKKTYSAYRELKSKLIATGVAVGFDVWGAVDLATKIVSMMQFAEYSVPALAYGHKSPRIERHVATATQKLQNYMPDIENIYVQTSENYEPENTWKLFNQTKDIVHKVFKDNEIQYPGYVKLKFIQ